MVGGLTYKRANGPHNPPSPPGGRSDHTTQPVLVGVAVTTQLTKHNTGQQNVPRGLLLFVAVVATLMVPDYFINCFISFWPSNKWWSALTQHRSTPRQSDNNGQHPVKIGQHPDNQTISVNTRSIYIGQHKPISTKYSNVYNSLCICSTPFDNRDFNGHQNIPCRILDNRTIYLFIK